MLQGSILQKLATAHTGGPRPLNFGVYYKNTLVALCHALEDSILTANSAPPLVITAFQRGKWYLQEAERYSQLAQASQQVIIMAAPDTGFAEHPTSQLPNVDLVALNPADPVAQEWHLMILSPSFTAMVLCQELSAADYGVTGVPSADLERKFYGFWTFEAGLVQETVELAIDHLGRYNPELQQKLIAQVQAMAKTRTVESDDLGQIVARVVDYLQTSELDLNQPQAFTHQQALDNNIISNELQAFLRLAQLTDIADTNNQMAASEVAAIAETMGQLLQLPAWQLKRLRLAGLLHRIAPLSVNVLPEGTSGSNAKDFVNIQYGEAPSCPIVPATQRLRTMPRTKAIAQIITHQAEWWNGSGQPAGFAGEEIPLESRILGLATDFQSRVARLRKSHHKKSEEEMPDTLDTALSECKQEEGQRWDPKLVATLELLVMGLKQGLTLPAAPPKISAGMWLIDTHSSSEAKTNREVQHYAHGH
ncbi:MAG: metal-dependent phosphohydrolase [Chroococcidiopsidaceae cyanobacterium CP_BM_ER_R8_30]|nr:metal-dependent phosphohydrolase [Chroococcidiopsidaceae cyanobacterium CP_BM_ER_R8_30]